MKNRSIFNKSLGDVNLPKLYTKSKKRSLPKFDVDMETLLEDNLKLKAEVNRRDGEIHDLKVEIIRIQVFV